MKILIAFDGSAGSRVAVDVVTGLRIPTGSVISVVEVVPSGPVRRVHRAAGGSARAS